MTTRVKRLCAFSLVAAALLVGAAGIGASRLGLDARVETLAPVSAQSTDATAAYTRAFGGDPIVVLVRGPWPVATSTRNLVILAALEGRLQRVAGVKLVEGPGTLVNSAATAALDVALGALRTDARAAGGAARAAALKAGRPASEADAVARAAEVDTLRRDTASLLERFPQIRDTGVPGLDNPRFVSAFLFRRDGSVKPLYRELFPRPGASLVVVRLSEGAGLTTVREVRQTVASTLRQFPLQGVQVVVSGAPVVEEGLTRSAVSELRTILPLAAVAMIAILILLLSRPLALLPLPVAAGGLVYTAGALDLLRRPTTLAAIAAVPVLLGLLVDYVVQLTVGGAQEESTLLPATLRRRARALTLAAVATVAGTLALLASPIPVVASLGTVMVVGVACGLLGLLLIAAPALLLSGRGPRFAPRTTVQRLTAGAATLGMRRPAILAVAGIAGLAGLALAPLQSTTSDIRNFASGGLPALHDLDTLERATGAAGEIDVLVDAPDIANPGTIRWMLETERRLSALLPANSPPPVSIADLLVAINQGTIPSTATAHQMFTSVPPYLLTGMVSSDRRLASMIVGVPLQDMGRQEQLVERMRGALQPPAGITARLAGDAVLAADGEVGLARTGLVIDLLALAAVASVLLLVTRRVGQVLAALVPMVLASGLTTLVVVALRIQITPISAVLGALVIALATEFSVIWSTRYREALAAGLGAGEAVAATAARTGSAIAVSGLTLCSGFLALAASSSPLLRSFGVVAGLGVATAAVAVLVLCPPLCVRLVTVAPTRARARLGVAGERADRPTNALGRILP